jgi:hypothetical protein
MVRFFRLTALFVLFSNFANASSLEDDILNALHRSGYPTVTRQHIQKIKAAGSNTDSVHLIRVESKGGKVKHLVCKELKGIKQERLKLEALEPFVKEYEQFKKSHRFLSKVLSIARYKGALNENNREFVLLKTASRQSVFDLMLEWAQKGYDSCYSLESSECKDTMSYHFNKVGCAIANFHLKYGVFNEEKGTFTTITHGDLHTSNVFYNIWSNKTTFIDYETMAREPNHGILLDTHRLFIFAKGETIPLVKEQAIERFVRSRNIGVINKQTQVEMNAYINKRLTLLDDFFHALKSGYTQAFKSAGYVCDTDTGQVKRDLM